MFVIGQLVFVVSSVSVGVVDAAGERISSSALLGAAAAERIVSSASAGPAVAAAGCVKKFGRSAGSVM